MERIDIVMTVIALMFLAAIVYLYWMVGDIQRWFGTLRRRIQNTADRKARSAAEPRDVQ